MIRAKLLSVSKLAALALFLSVVAALIVYLGLRNKRISSSADHPKLQGRMVAVFNSTRYVHAVEGTVRFVLTAGTDKTYEDGTHELEQVQLESHGVSGDRNDVITADRAKVSDTSDLNKLDAEFISNVVVQTSDGLTLKTNYLHYDHLKNTIDTSEVVEFFGKNLSGRCTGLVIEVAEERARLLKDVDVTLGGSEAAQADQKPPAVAAAHKLERRQTKTRIVSQEALLEKKQRRATFIGGVVITQAANQMRADKVIGYFDRTSLERVEARGSAYLREEGKSEIKSSDMDFFFADGHRLVRAVAIGRVYARSLGPEPLREVSAESIEVSFAPRPQGNAAEVLKATGSAVVKVHPPAAGYGKATPAEREISAEVIQLWFFPDGRSIKHAQASGNAVLSVIPTRAERNADKKTIRAPQMSADFSEGNLAEIFDASGGVEVEIVPLIAGARQPRTTTSKSLRAKFSPASQDIDVIIQEGDFRYNEGDRNARAERAIYDDRAEVLSLRGHRPALWDSKARLEADEIDYDRQKDETHARGQVRTTYYSRDTANDSTPFKNTKSPIFLTADRADARNGEGVANYVGNARGWQDDNFVRADQIELYQEEKRMVAIGHVESALYNAKRKSSSGSSEVTPGFASADRMLYSDKERLIRYEGHVKARQGTDQIQAAVVDVYLKQETNEVDHLVAQGGVLVEQPGRRGIGDKLTYAADDGVVVLVGKNARIDDEESGSTMGAKLTFSSRDDKISIDNQQGAGRVRSIHKLTKGKEKK
jgi:LPS export ABC transporter protein LptC/lipopolysaccharide transport protein LptA